MSARVPRRSPGPRSATVTLQPPGVSDTCGLAGSEAQRPRRRAARAVGGPRAEPRVLADRYPAAGGHSRGRAGDLVLERARPRAVEQRAPHRAARLASGALVDRKADPDAAR